MKFWDSSAVVSLLVEEAVSAHFTAVYASDPEMMVWWATQVECASALARRARERSGRVAAALQSAQTQLTEFVRRWHEVVPVQEVRNTALRLVKTHPLRAADALQLAAVLAARGEQASPLEFVCADEQLIAAARLEGLTVATPDVVREPRAKYRRRRKEGRTR